MVPLAFHSLSALRPVKLVYDYNNAEKFTANLSTYKNGFSYYKHDALENAQDAVFSNKTCVIVTDNIPLKQVFESDSKLLTIGTIAGSFYLNLSNRKLTTSGDQVFVGGTGAPLLLSLVPLGDNTVELKFGKTHYLQVDAEYPYTARITDNVLDKADLVRQRFVYDYKDKKISFRTLTKEGWRFLSAGVDQTVRAVGLILNETKVNSYFFEPEFVSNDSIYYNFDAKSSEVKYYNELPSFDNRETVAIKTQQESNTNLLITCPTNEIAKTTEAKVNIALTKSNFSSTGSYVTKKTLL
jgi:hypothetical protein